MKANRFFELVELPTKVASVFPFIIGTLYALYRYGRINGINLLVMAIAMLSLDMSATALNNYMDYKRAIKTHGFNYEQQNAIVKYKLKENTVRWVIGGMASISMILGVYLFLRTDIVVLFLGMVSFFFAAIYSWGPFPISRTPLGEIVSGVVMGGIIPFISAYIHIFDQDLIRIGWTDGTLLFHLDVVELVGFFVVSLPLIAGISNIMLANNTCDMEDDFENRRFTLPLVIGKENALRLFAGIYGLGYVAIIIGSVIGWLPKTSLAVIVTVIPVRKNVLKFFDNQSKKETFLLSVQNFVIMSAAYAVSLAVGLLLK